MQWLQFQNTRKSQWIIPIYIKVFYDENMSYLTVSTDNVLNATNNDTPLTELRRVFYEYFEIKVQEVYFIKYLNFRICQYPLGFIIDKTYRIMELVSEWFPTGKFRKFDTTFLTDSTY